VKIDGFFQGSEFSDFAGKGEVRYGLEWESQSLLTSAATSRWGLADGADESK
jgi:hypothetical protein